MVAGARERRPIVEQQGRGGLDPGGARIARVGAADGRHVGARRREVLGVERQLGAKGERAGVRRVHRQRARELVARRRRVVAVVERGPRQPDVRVGVVGIDLEHLAERGLCIGGVVLLEQQRPPVEVGADLLAIGADGVAQDVVGVLPVLVEADRGGDRPQIGRLGPIDLPAVPVGVAGVDERLPGGAIAGRFVEAHERVAQRKIAGVRGRRRSRAAAAPRDRVRSPFPRARTAPSRRRSPGARARCRWQRRSASS